MLQQFVPILQLTGALRVDILPKCGSTLRLNVDPRDDRLELLQGTLDLLILRTLILGPQHGQGIARTILQSSYEELLIEHGALQLRAATA